MTLTAQNEKRSIEPLCTLLGVTKQAYYKRKRREEREALGVELVVQEVLSIRAKQKRIGGRKLLHMTEEFRAGHGITLGRDAFFEVLREHSLLVRRRRTRKPRTTDSTHRLRRYPNLIREFVPGGANELWVSDITYLSVGAGFAYLSLVTDAYSRKIVGYHLNRDLTAEGPVMALKKALSLNPEHKGLIHHSDRGTQYCSSEYITLLTDGVRVSMTEKGDPLENAIAERVNGILKAELLEIRYDSFRPAQREVARAVSIYNFQRPHMSIDMLTPAEAHRRRGKLKRRWRNYYPQKRVTDSMTEAVQEVAYATS